LALDPGSVEAQSFLAISLAARAIEGWTDSAPNDIERAERLSQQALTESPRSPLAHCAKGQVMRAQKGYVEAIPEYEMAIALNRNLVSAYVHLGECKFFTGSIEEAIPLVEQAIRINPYHPCIGRWYFVIGTVHLLESRTDEAIAWFERARTANLEHPVTHAHLAAAYALKGEIERAVGGLAEARRLSADDRFSSIAHLRAIGYFGVPKVRALFETTYFAGLHKAGMPVG
jgi:tetratricopeptide (TPR) repeat protein